MRNQKYPRKMIIQINKTHIIIAVVVPNIYIA